MRAVFEGKTKGYGKLDYVTAFYVKALEYIKGTSIEVAFVSTRTITHGEQVAPLWSYLLAEGIRINFAHRSFWWTNSARGKAIVRVVIIGFSMVDRPRKILFEYVGDSDEPIATRATNINPYLVDFDDILITKRNKPFFDVPKVTRGSHPVDGGFLLLSDREKAEYINKEPQGEEYIRQLMGGAELLYNVKRWCFWLEDIDPPTFDACRSCERELQELRRFG
jgi:hypothetical protein